jgi:hypothetical protein
VDDVADSVSRKFPNLNSTGSDPSKASQVAADPTVDAAAYRGALPDCFKANATPAVKDMDMLILDLLKGLIKKQSDQPWNDTVKPLIEELAKMVRGAK